MEIGDGADVDLTIVRPAAAAPPRRLEQVGPRACVKATRMGNAAHSPLMLLGCRRRA